MANSHRCQVLKLTLILFLVFCFAFLFNSLWEALHAVYLYEEHDFNASKYVPMVLYVSYRDSLLILGTYLGVSIIWLNIFWIRVFTRSRAVVFSVIGIAVGAAIEYLAVFYFHRWMYKESMPTVVGIGISPLLQLSVTGLMAVWLTRRLMFGKEFFHERNP